MLNEIELIQSIVAEYYHVDLDELLGPKRSKNINSPRQIAMYFCRALTENSLPAIGKAFNRHHTTVMYAYQNTEARLSELGTSSELGVDLELLSEAIISRFIQDGYGYPPHKPDPLEAAALTDDTWEINLLTRKGALRAQEKQLRIARRDFEFVLNNRQRALDEKFVWDVTTRERFLFIQDLLVSKYTEAWDEAVTMAEDIERRIALGEINLTDYEIDVKLGPYMEDDRDSGYTTKDYLTEYMASRYLSDSISHSLLEKGGKPKSIMLGHCDDLAPDWKGRLLGVFDDSVHIAHIMHTLIEQAGWAFEDILSIQSVQSSIEVIYQSCTDIEPMNMTGVSSEGDAQ